MQVTIISGNNTSKIVVDDLTLEFARCLFSNHLDRTKNVISKATIPLYNFVMSERRSQVIMNQVKNEHVYFIINLISAEENRNERAVITMDPRRR
uniref:Uncharacterized protein n=1 Tax=Panagrolaimus sp. ES5 TaxID=591445 RepID=A0AC34FUS2_9BILA